MAEADLSTVFALAGDACITAEEHFGIKGFMLTASVPHRDALSVRGLWAPPYASTDFLLEVRLRGETVPTSAYWWNGNECRRQGHLGELRVESALVVAMEQRCALLEFTVTNTGDAATRVPVQLVIRGGVDCVSFWEFAGPGSTEAALPWADRARGWQVAAGDPGLLLKTRADGELAVATSLPEPRWETMSGHWEARVPLAAGESLTCHVAMALDAPGVAAGECREMLRSGAEGVARARREWADCVAEVFARVPRLAASDSRLVAFYNRSLVGLLLNQWRVPEFVTSPYYSTGGINGGCVCCYLWDFGEPWQLLTLYDPKAVKAHIRQFLSIDTTKHFAWVPTTGDAFGPWYPVNQEKIIFLIYYHVLFQDDVSFLQEQVAGRSVLDWVLYHAHYRSPRDLPVSLIDYGKGNNHLELRGNYLPDMNGRRYANYLAAYELSRLAGRPDATLPARAEAIKGLLKQLMWSSEHRWFHHLDENFAPALCYNVQLLKLIGSGVLDEEELVGLLSHLNEEEFLSDWGLHSMSKLDPAYDQVDIDNGGGGNYTAFTPQIIERLYKAGRPVLAEDVLQRVLWWGERMPYWGDSIVANNVDYRRDTPLQNTIGAVAGAQMLIFGLFGVSVRPDGAIIVSPRPPSFCRELKLTGLQLRGRRLDITVTDGQFAVNTRGQTSVSLPGVPVLLPPE